MPTFTPPPLPLPLFLPLSPSLLLSPSPSNHNKRAKFLFRLLPNSLPPLPFPLTHQNNLSSPRILQNNLPLPLPLLTRKSYSSNNNNYNNCNNYNNKYNNSCSTKCTPNLSFCKILTPSLLPYLRSTSPLLPTLLPRTLPLFLPLPLIKFNNRNPSSNSSLHSNSYPLTLTHSQKSTHVIPLPFRRARTIFLSNRLFLPLPQPLLSLSLLPLLLNLRFSLRNLHMK